MIVSGTLLLPVAGQCLQARQGWLTVRQGCIERVETGQPPGEPDLGGPGAWVLPGLIDAHLHLPQFDAIGSTDATLLRWLERTIYPAEGLWRDPELARGAVERICRRLLALGTTAICAYATVHHAAARAAMDACRAQGLRAAVGQVLMDRNAPEPLMRSCDDQLRDVETLLGDYPPGRRVESAVAPRFALSCSQELLDGAGALAREYGAVVQTHLAETREETDAVCRMHGVSRYLDVYRRAELLGPRTILAHGIWLDDADRERLAESGAVVAHCPTANEFLASGTMDRLAMRSAGVRLAIGSDVAGGPDPSMVHVARGMVRAARSLGAEAPSAGHCWWQVTAGNADALGWSTTGRLAPGMDADLLVVAPDAPVSVPPDPLAWLLYAWDPRWIRAVLAGGTVCYASP
jgi:guanine deaminase